MCIRDRIYADYLLVDSWYAKPNFIYEIKEKGLDVIARLSKSNRIWQFTGKYKTLEKPVSYTHLRAHETVLDLVCRLLLEKKKSKKKKFNK